MTDKTIIVGYVPALVKAAEDSQAPGSLLIVDDPAVAGPRDYASKVAVWPSVGGLIPFDYTRADAADRFFHEHRDLRIAAVIPALEYAVEFAARLAERYGTPGATLGAAHLLRDKAQLRTVSAAAGVRNPLSEPVSSPEQVRDFARRIGGPVIIKPTNRQASIGTMIVRDLDEIEDAWAGAMHQQDGPTVADQHAPATMLVEEFVTGPEYSVEMLIRHGANIFGNVTGKILFPGDRPVEQGHLVPANIPAELTRALLADTEAVADAVGFRDGVLHCEWIVSAGQPYLVECAGRLPGDSIVDLIARAWPIDLVGAYLTVMRGGQPDPAPTVPRQGGAAWSIVAPPGIVTSVDGVEQARAVPGVHFAGCFVNPGDQTHELRSSWDRIAGSIAYADTAEQALAAARESLEKITITVRPDLP